MEAQQQALSAQLQAMKSDIKPAKKPRAVTFQDKVDGAIASLSDTVDRLEQIVGAHTPPQEVPDSQGPMALAHMLEEYPDRVAHALACVSERIGIICDMLE
jgi:hypothetical protein